MKKSLGIAILATSVILGSAPAFAKSLETAVTFKKGTYSTNLKGTFKGYDDARYTLHAKAGQRLKFKTTSTGDLAYINIYAPGDKPGKAEALWIGSTAGSAGEVILPSTGQYTLQVYQMRNTARRGKSVSFKVDIQILNQVP
ncbi:MAG: DNA breaking-rejoining protein [Acinetobacter bohemicus]|jgi:hypothetical protein